MALINFPASPSLNQVYVFQAGTAEEKSFIFKAGSSGTASDGYWAAYPSTGFGPATAAEINAGTEDIKYIAPDQLLASDYKKLSYNDDRYVNVTGDTMTGKLTANGGVQVLGGLGKGIIWEGGAHAMTNNDGGGNFSLRIAHHFTNGITEEGFAHLDVYGQVTGDRVFQSTTASQLVGEAPVWGNAIRMTKDGQVQVLADPANNNDLARKFYVDGTLITNTNGYQKFPGGLIIAWGNETMSSTVPQTWTLPIAMIGYSVTCSFNTDLGVEGSANQLPIRFANGIGTSNTEVITDYSGINATPRPFSYIAIGLAV